MRALNDLKMGFTEAQLGDMLQILDCDGTGKIYYIEYLKALGDSSNKKVQKAQLSVGRYCLYVVK